MLAALVYFLLLFQADQPLQRNQIEILGVSSLSQQLILRILFVDVLERSLLLRLRLLHFLCGGLRLDLRAFPLL